jgi:aspartokinase-like uncharacterized kinase
MQNIICPIMHAHCICVKENFSTAKMQYPTGNNIYSTKISTQQITTSVKELKEFIDNKCNSVLLPYSWFLQHNVQQP